MPCRSPGPYPGRRSRGLVGGGVSRPTLRGQVDGSEGGLQAHTLGGKVEMSGQGDLQAHTRGGGVSRPTPRGVYPSMH